MYKGKILAGNHDTFRIESLDDRWRMHNVRHEEGSYVVDVRKDLFRDEVPLLNSGWKISSSKLYFSLLAALYQNKDHPDPGQKDLVESCRQMQDRIFYNNWVRTSTKVVISDNQGLIFPDDSGYIDDVIEPGLARMGGWLEDNSADADVFEKIFDEKDLSKLSDVFSYISGGRRTFLLGGKNGCMGNGFEQRGVVSFCTFYGGRFNIYLARPVQDWPVQGVKIL